MKVVDAGVLAEAFCNIDKVGKLSRTIISAEDDLYAPDSFLGETLSAIRKIWVRKQITEFQFRTYVHHLEIFEVNLVPSKELIRLALRHRHNVGAHDSLYVALAEKLGCPLVTTDIRLSRAPGISCEVITIA